MTRGRWETRVAIVDSGVTEDSPLAPRVESLGLETRAFEGGIDLLRALSRLEIDCVVVDLREPRSDASLVSRVAATGLAPVVAVVPRDGAELCRRALSAGAFACVSEPSDVHALRRAIFAALTGAPSEARSAPIDRDFRTDRRIPCLSPTSA